MDSSNFIYKEQINEDSYSKLLDKGKFTYTFLNKDGTKTIYLSSAPIENGEFYIEKDAKGYCRNGDYCKVNMPEYLSPDSGFSIKEDLIIVPVDDIKCNSYIDERINIFGQKRQCIIYKNYCSDNIDLYCYATSFGINMEIIIHKKTENNVFTFKIKQLKDKLSAKLESPDYILFKTEKGLDSAAYTPLAIDADFNRTYNNYIELTEDINDNSFILSFVIDKDFLNDSNTKYPVTANQSIYAYVPKQSDTAIYSGAGDMGSHHLSPYMLIGDSTLKGEGWGFVRFEELHQMDIPADKVIKSEYFIYNLFDDNKEAEIGAFANLEDWCSVNTRWRTKPRFRQVPVGTVTVKTQGKYSIDITRLFIDMMKNKNVYMQPLSIRNSFFIKSLTKNTDLFFASGDSGLFSPYLKIKINSD